ncbi:MAG: hypothetical protein KC766_31820 [Myxococcales bacterium]|nr:hypothetical protein [Myxococcales bacterium]
MANARKVVVLAGLFVAACGGKVGTDQDRDVSGSGGYGAQGDQAGSSNGGTAPSAQGGSGPSGQGGSGPSGQGGSQPAAVGGNAGSGGARECFPGEENECSCGGFSACQPDGTWAPCSCSPGACDDDETQNLDVYQQCARQVCIGDLSTAAFQPCVQRCAQDTLGVSAACSDCMSELVECAVTTCISRCINDENGSCNDCLCAEGCAQRARACAGDNAELPVCELP